MAERKFVLTKVAAGDYLLPSNDMMTLWRIAVYEDGPSHGIEDWPADKTLWAVRRWEEPVGEGSFIDTGDWDRWPLVEDGFDTRKAAIDWAMKQPAATSPNTGDEA